MARALVYIVAAGLVWFAEGFVFSQFLGLHTWQTVILALVYLTLFGVAIHAFRRRVRATQAWRPGMSEWRLLALAPMLVVIVGSFASLPILLLVIALGRVFG